MQNPITPSLFLADLDDYIDNGANDFQYDDYLVDGSLQIDVAQYEVEVSLLTKVRASSGDDIVLFDKTSKLLGLSDDDLIDLSKYGVHDLEWSGHRPLFSVAQQSEVADAGVKPMPKLAKAITVSELASLEADPGMLAQWGVSSVYVDDTAANVETLTPTQISSIPSFVTDIEISDTTLDLTVAQAVALENAALPIERATKSIDVWVVDTKKNIEGLGPNHLAALGYIGVNEISDEHGNPPTFTDAQMTALGKAGVSVVTPPDDPTQNDGTTTVVGADGGMTINVIWASSVASAPADFETMVIEGEQDLANAISSPITANIVVGYGEINNSPGGIAPGFSVGSAKFLPQQVSYADLVADLQQHATTAAQKLAYGDLPPASAGSVQGRSAFNVSDALADALDIAGGAGVAVDGNIGLGVGFTGNTLIGGVLHETAHALGRDDNGTILDLFRYFTSSLGSGSPQHDFTSGTTPAYFSIDGGVTRLADFGTSTDSADFLNAPDSELTPSDPFDQDIAGHELTPVDLVELNVMGFAINKTQTYTPGVLDKFAQSDFDLLKMAGVKTLAATGGDVTLTLAQYDELVGDRLKIAGEPVTVEADLATILALSTAAAAAIAESHRLAVFDMAATIEALTSQQISSLADLKVSLVEADDVRLVISMSEALALEAAGIAAASPLGGGAVLSDSSSALEVLTAAQLAALKSIGIVKVDASEAVTLTAGEALNFESAAIAVQAPSGDIVEVADHAGKLEGLTASEIADLKGILVTELVSTRGDVNFSASQTQAILTAGLTVVAQGDATVTENFADGDYSVYQNGELITQKTANLGGGYEIFDYDVAGESYTSDERVYTSLGAEIAFAANNADGSGALTLEGVAQTKVVVGPGSLKVAAGVDAFTLKAHATETISAAGAGLETFVFAPASATLSVDWAVNLDGFVAKGSAHDILHFTASAFGGVSGSANDLTLLLDHTVQGLDGAVITDLFGDSLTLAGVSKLTLAAAGSAGDFKFT